MSESFAGLQIQNLIPMNHSVGTQEEIYQAWREDRHSDHFVGTIEFLLLMLSCLLMLRRVRRLLVDGSNKLL